MDTFKRRLDRFGEGLASGFQIAALFVIGATIVWSAVTEYQEMMRAGHAKLDDILVLFIYLELGTMVGIYFKTERLPVIFLLYVAITAITRFLVVDVSTLPVHSVLIVSGTILLLTIAVLALQFTRSRFETPPDPAPSGREGSAASSAGVAQAAPARREPDSAPS